ncbi:protein abrupt [Nilaparvata lugens]|uniref:protein abrupt n=1 Tax=Nilaparvata lugens TaxID=108931 RepID=UPI00193DD915|nr:protein abrupt [Nilaparvata lugens]
MGSTKVLAWGEFSSSLASTVQALHGHEELVDVTLAADGRSFPAHKLVLSAASPLLMDLLKNSGCQHPVVLLAGITARDLEALLQFVYQGEVSVDPNQLPSLLQAANCLDIQAFLSIALSEDLYSSSQNDEAMMSQSMMSPTRKRRRKHKRMPEHKMETEAHEWHQPTSAVSHSTSIECQTDSLDENIIENHHLCMESGSAAENSGSETIEETTICIDGQMTTLRRMPSDQPAECPVCGAFIKQSRNLKRHIQIKHRDAHIQFAAVRKRRRKTSASASTAANASTAPTASQDDNDLECPPVEPIPETPEPASASQAPQITDLQPMRWYSPLWTSAVPGTSTDVLCYSLPAQISPTVVHRDHTTVGGPASPTTTTTGYAGTVGEGGGEEHLPPSTAAAIKSE